MLNNESFKYAGNDESDEKNLLFNYRSQESENKFRAENSIFGKGYTLKYGVNYEFSRYLIDNFDRATLSQSGGVIDILASSTYASYGAFVSGTKNWLGERLLLSGGLRMDGSDFAKTASNPLNQLSPRLSVSYQLRPNLFATANGGIYYQRPAYTILGFQNNAGDFVNQESDVRFIRNAQVITGIEYLVPDKARRFTAEAFYKRYTHYPSSIRNGISLANLGADFGAIGNEPVASTSEGRAYGVELLAQQRLFRNFFGVASLTLVRSEFSNTSGGVIAPSSWDNRFIVSMTAGKRFGKNWEIGGRWRYLGGTPYTPADLAVSSLRENWDLRNAAISDFSRINGVRLKPFHQLDLRVDKRYFFDAWSLNWYVDIQNAYNFQAQQAPLIIPVRDSQGNLTLDPTDPSRYQLRTLANPAGTLLATVGLIVEF